MSLLKPFLSEKAKFLLDADAQVHESILKFEYCLIDKVNLFELSKVTQLWNPSQVLREDELWKHTCFEAFLNPLGLEIYYELNFSLKPAWNLYRFERYRFPQPPPVNSDFEIQSFNWDSIENKLKVELKNKTKYKKFKIGLTAVLEEKNGNKNYCALEHLGSQPDFHSQDSFTIIRG